MHKRRILTIQQVVRETPDTITIHFAQPATDRVWYRSGQYLTLMANRAGKDVYRCYSISTAPRLDDTLGITVKAKPGGQLSSWLVNEAVPGWKMEAIDPLGKFFVEISVKNRRHLVLFAAGSGISPLYSILRSVLFGEPESKVTLIYSSRNWSETIFRESIEKLSGLFPDRFSAYLHLSEPEQVAGTRPRLTPADVVRYCRQTTYPEVAFYVCGPLGYRSMVTSSLVTSGIGRECIFEENFDLSSNEARDLSEVGDLHPQEVVVNWQGHAHHFRVAAGATILESALGQDIALPYSCKRGVCSACMGHLLKGKVAMARQDVLLEFEVEKGLLLLCQAYPLSENVEVEVGF